MLPRTAGGALGDRGNLLHAAQHLPHPLGLILGLGGECRRELDRGIEIGEKWPSRAPCTVLATVPTPSLLPPFCIASTTRWIWFLRRAHLGAQLPPPSGRSAG